MKKYLLVALALVASGCNFNIFQPFDSASGDPQHLSAARAALDRGDFPKALSEYAQLSDADADIRASEEAFAVMDRYGVGMAAFANAFGGGKDVNPGVAITSITNALGKNAGATARLDIFHAFQSGILVSNANSSLRGMVRFLTALAFLADMLGEKAVDPTHLAQTDLAASAAACLSGGDAGCVTTPAPCDSGPSTGTVGTFVSLTSATDADVTTNAPSLVMIQSALDQVTIALGEIGGGGGLSGALSGFTGSAQFDDTKVASNPSCYRYGLLKQGIGSY